jgi:hypothetical protein
MTSSILILKVLASLQRALLGFVTQDLRAVDVIFEDEENFTVIFYYNRELSEDEEELSSLAETEFMSDFPPPYFHIERILKILPYPNRIDKIPHNGFRVYECFEK